MDELDKNPYQPFMGDYVKPGLVYSEGQENKTAVKVAVKEQAVIDNLKQVYDPEIPVNIYDLGLIYKVEIDKFNNLDITMTLTTPNCPVAGILPTEIGNAAFAVPELHRVQVFLTFDPPWDMSKISEDAKMALNLY